MAKGAIRWGVIGPGRIADRFGKGVKAVRQAELYAVASRSRDRAEAYAKSFRVKQVYDSYQALAEDPQVDVVYIATPHRFHYENALICLEAGKHVLCEKPMTVNAAQSERLFAAAKQRDLFIMEAMWTYFLPIYSVVRKWLEDRAIGDLKLMSSTFGFQAVRDEKHRCFNLELAGGALLDIGIYNLAISRWVVQEEVQGFDVRAQLGSTGVDEFLAGNLEFSNGIISQYACTYNAVLKNDFSIYGTKGRIEIHSPFWAALKATLVTEREEKTVTRVYKGGGFEFEIDEVCRCVQAGLLESPVMPHRLTLANMQLMDAIRKDIGLVYPFE
jgi:predicted dehydrogenase